MTGTRPNILIIMSDQHHAGIMGCAGDGVVRTPNLDRLAEQGVRFDSAYCPFPICGPSRMSFMTGRHPFENRHWDNESQLCSDIPTFAHAFLAAGYDTVLAGRMHFVGQDQRHGFAERIISDVPETAYLASGWRLGRVLGDLSDTPGMGLKGLVKSGPGNSGYLDYDKAVTRATTGWLGRRGQDRNPTPFLLTVGYVCPHCPFVAEPDDFAFYADRIACLDLPGVDENLHPVNATRRQRFGTDPIPPLDAQWRTRVAYYGLCTALDRRVGELLRALEANGLAENTIVVYCSDHGETLGEHGMWWKSSFYEGASRVPLLLSWPGRIPGGTVRAEHASLMDIGPTLLDLAGADPLPGATGRSLRPVLQDDVPDWDDTVFAEYVMYGSRTVCRMVRSGPWKYNYYHGCAPELFNLADDPEELHNRAGEPALNKVEADLRARALQDWDPEMVADHVVRRRQEQALAAHWEKKTAPPEPDPVWFEKAPENWVDNTVQPRAEG